MENIRTLSIFSVTTLFLLIFLTNADPYEYLLHVQQWQPAVCSTPNNNCLSPPQQRFSVHGVWHGNISNGASVLNCQGRPFNPGQLRPILKYLTADWPDVIRNQHTGFWVHEWNTHGKCSDGVFNQLQYFSIGYQKLRAYNISTILSNARFAPNNQHVNATLVAAAIKTAIGKQPALRCTNKRGSIQNLKQLTEVVLCFDHNARLLIDCPQRLHVCPTNSTVLFSK